MRILVPPQEYKGTLTASEAAAAIAAGARRACPDAEVEELPLADGGPGTAEAIVRATGGEWRSAPAHDALGRPLDAAWALLADGTAVIEMAAAAGLTMIESAERDPRIASTFGVGEVIRAALDAGCPRAIVGLGGSATNDGGAGMARALGVRLLNAAGDELPPGGAALARLYRIDATGLDVRVAGTRFVGATDVRNTLCGPEGASLVYGAQKGASPEAALELDAALRHYAAVVERDVGIPVAGVPGAGSAGGLGAGLIAFLGAEIRPGIDVVAEAVRLRERLTGVDLVLTGEGRLDGQTGYGKTVAGLARIAHEAGVPVIVVPGTLGDGWQALLPLVGAVEPAGPDGGSPAQALAAAAERAVRAWVSR